MQTKPLNWDSVFSGSHKIEYRFIIDGVTYQGSDLKETPTIKKPLLDKPAIGRCCTGSLQLKIFPKGDIPKAALVDAYCRLCSEDGNTVTAWIPQGKYYISTRSGKNVLQLNCLDRMIKAGKPYQSRTAFTQWPQPMTAVVNEICSIMDVALDSRTYIRSGVGYMVDYPNEDTLISEVLGYIAAAHGGNWIITEAGKLRLVILSSPSSGAAQTLGKVHGGFTIQGKQQTISKVVLEDDAGNQFSAGDDTGLTLSTKCFYATTETVDELCRASISRPSILYGVTYQPYTLTQAYLDPAIELGDTISVTDRNDNVYLVVAFSISMSCTIAGTCSLSAAVEGETESEFPYITKQELSISRALSTDKKYYGNRINRSEGFVSELVVDDVVKARMTANASVFSMQSQNNGIWADRIYFDPISGKYVISGDVTVQGLATFEQNLAIGGSTIIDGGNITTGVIQSHDGRVQFDLDQGVISVNNQDLESALAAIDHTIQIFASGQMFTKGQSASAYSPSSITLTAQSTATLSSYQWYKNNTAISGATAQALTVYPNDIDGSSATFKVIGTDGNGKTYTDVMSIAKLSDGQPGSPGAAGADGQDSYTAILDNEYIEIAVDTNRKPLAAGSFYCTVSVYKGLTALTPTTGTLAEGQFKVTPGTSPTGVTVSQNTAGTITLTVAKSTAISDSASLPLTITVYGGFTIHTNIAIHANMNNVTVTQQASIEANANAITLKVNKGDIASEINQTAQSVLISAAKIDLSGFVTVNSLANGTTTINGGCITTGTINANLVSIINLNADSINTGTLSASRISGGTLDCSNITVTNLDASEILANGISANLINSGTLNCNLINVSNLSASSISSGTLSASRISGGTLDCSNITVSNLSASSISSGTLSASRISGGTLDCSNMTVTNLSASSIDTSTLKVKNLYYDNNNVMVSGNNNTVYLGGNGSWGVSNANVYASNAVGIGGSNSWQARVVFDVANRTIAGSNSSYGWSLGTANLPFARFYCSQVSLGSSGYNGAVGFFGATPTTRKTISKASTSATLAQLITAFNNLVTGLAGYGLIKT